MFLCSKTSIIHFLLTLSHTMHHLLIKHSIIYTVTSGNSRFLSLHSCPLREAPHQVLVPLKVHTKLRKGINVESSAQRQWYVLATRLQVKPFSLVISTWICFQLVQPHWINGHLACWWTRSQPPPPPPSHSHPLPSPLKLGYFSLAQKSTWEVYWTWSHTQIAIIPVSI